MGEAYGPDAGVFQSRIERDPKLRVVVAGHHPARAEDIGLIGRASFPLLWLENTPFTTRA